MSAQSEAPAPSTAKSTLKQKMAKKVEETWTPYRSLLPYLRPYRGRFIAGILCGAGAGVVSGLFGLAIKHVTDQVFHGQGHVSKLEMLEKGPPITALLWTCALIPAIMILRNVLSYLNAYCISWVSLRVLNDLRNAIFKSVIHQSLDFFNKSQSGKLMSRVMNDSRVAQTALTQISSDIMTQPFTIIGALGTLFWVDWKFSLISLLLFPLCLVPIIVYGRKVRKGGADEETTAGGMLTILHEAIGGIRVVKALAREPFEIKDFTEAGEEQFGRAIRTRKSIEIVGPIIESISAVGVGLALVYVWATGMTTGGFMALITGLFMLYDPTKKLSKVHVQLQKALSATERIFEMMDEAPTVQDAPDALQLPKAKGAITFEDVHFRYRENLPLALRGINLTIAPGKTYALVGASGSGKSTMLSLLLRFYDPHAGRICIDGTDLRSVTQESLRKQIAIVNQDTFLFHTSILENIRYGRIKATDEEVYYAAEQAFAHDFICAQADGYQTVVGDKGCNLSGGQQQRIAIARALLRNAPILFLDEATSALDSESEMQIQIALERLSQGRTVIAIAHRLSTILKADQIVAMHEGQIMEVGNHAELFARNGHYRRLYDLQFNNHKDEEEEETLVSL